jgi:hypothetical protein
MYIMEPVIESEDLSLDQEIAFGCGDAWMPGAAY